MTINVEMGPNALVGYADARPDLRLLEMGSASLTMEVMDLLGVIQQKALEMGMSNCLKEFIKMEGPKRQVGLGDTHLVLCQTLPQLSMVIPKAILSLLFYPKARSKLNLPFLVDTPLLLEPNLLRLVPTQQLLGPSLRRRYPRAQIFEPMLLRIPYPLRTEHILKAKPRIVLNVAVRQSILILPTFWDQKWLLLAFHHALTVAQVQAWRIMVQGTCRSALKMYKWAGLRTFKVQEII